MASHLSQGDLLAGGVAAAVLAVLVFGLGVTPFVAVPLAVAAYAGAMLLQPRRRRQEQVSEDARQGRLAYEAALANVAAIRDLAQGIAKPPVREQVGRILDRTDRILTVMRVDDNLAMATVFNDQLLELFRSILTEYVLLSTREIKSADGLLKKIETNDLALIERVADDFYEQLHRRQMIDLATLSDVLELNLESVRATTPRRVTP